MLYSLMSICAVVAAIPEAETIQQQALQARRAVVSGKIEYDLSFSQELTEEGKPRWNAILCRNRLVFDTEDGWHAFMEQWMPLRANLSPGQSSLLKPFPQGGAWERFLVTPDETFQCFPSAEEIVVYQEPYDHDRRNTAIVSHPWKFGMTAYSTFDFPRANLEDVVAPKEFQDRSVSEDSLEGEICWRIRYRDAKGYLVNVWYDPTKDMNVRQFAVEGTHELGDFKTVVTSELKKHPAANVWFPSDVIYTSVLKGSLEGALKGKTQRIFERIRVHQAELNIPIDPAQFTRDAMLTRIPTIK